MKSLIIIPTYNNEEILRKCISSIRQFDKKTDIVVVNNGEFISDLDEIQLMNKVGGYAIGALFATYKYYSQHDGYLLIQDSLFIKDKNFLKEFERKSKLGFGAIAWLTFPIFFDSEEQKQYLIDIFGVDGCSNFGVFGPIIYLKNKTISKFIKENYYKWLPKNKNELCGWERGIAMACLKCNIKFTTIHPLSWDNGRLRNNEYTLFNKIFLDRQ